MFPPLFQCLSFVGIEISVGFCHLPPIETQRRRGKVPEKACGAAYARVMPTRFKAHLAPSLGRHRTGLALVWKGVCYEGKLIFSCRTVKIIKLAKKFEILYELLYIFWKFFFRALSIMIECQLKRKVLISKYT